MSFVVELRTHTQEGAYVCVREIWLYFRLCSGLLIVVFAAGLLGCCLTPGLLANNYCAKRVKVEDKSKGRREKYTLPLC